jgi:asparagine synthase (glutamine-hydrolysing)
MKVVLTGEGADELFGGYGIFKEDKIRRFWARRPDSAWRHALLSRIHHEVGGGGGAQDGRMWREFFKRGLADTQAPFYSHAVRWENTAWGTRFLRRDLAARVAPAELEAALEATLPEGWRSWPALGRAQMIEIATFLSPYLLVAQGDRVAMGHSVEARYPFLDPEVTHLAGRLPPRLKLSGLRDKLVLRALGKRHLPPEIASRRKQPYRAPTSSAFFGPGAPDYVRAMLSPESLDSHGLVEPGPARMLAEKAWSRNGAMAGEREEMALMGILTLQLLAEWVRKELPAEARRLHDRLKQVPPNVLEDRTPIGASRSSPK